MTRVNPEHDKYTIYFVYDLTEHMTAACLFSVVGNAPAKEKETKFLKILIIILYRAACLTKSKDKFKNLYTLLAS